VRALEAGGPQAAAEAVLGVTNLMVVFSKPPRDLEATKDWYVRVLGMDEGPHPDFGVPVYNLMVIVAAIAIAVALGAFLQRTNFGRILRATAENRSMAEALGVDVRRVYSVVFTLGAALGTTAGALIVPTAAASLDMAIEFVVEAFAVVVIGGLGSMRGALVGALIVGLIRAYAIMLYPELEVLAIYFIVIAVLLLRPAGLFGRSLV